MLARPHQLVQEVCVLCVFVAKVKKLKFSFLRLFVTLERALRFDEPALLVGETGGGKTTVCQMISSLMTRQLAIINCHANTEAADFIGGLRPVR